jgi:hypothetical protein
MKTPAPTLLTCLLLCLALTPAIAAPSGSELGGESPAALVERLRQAAADENFGEFAACLAPPARKEMAMGLWTGTTMMIGMASSTDSFADGLGEAIIGAMEGEAASSEEAAKAKQAKAELEKKFADWQKRYDDVMAKYGLPKLSAQEDPGDLEEHFAKIDLVGLTNDLGGLLKLFRESEGGRADTSVPEGQLEDLVIEGDTARGMLGGDVAEMIRIDGRWYIKKIPEKDQIPAGN